MTDRAQFTNEISDLLAAPLVLAANSRSALLSAVVSLVGWIGYWKLEAPTDTTVLVVVTFGVCVPLGAILGYRAAENGHTKSLRIAIGVGWRIGAIWCLTAAAVEFFVTDQTSVTTVIQFPLVFGLSMLVVGSTFLIGFLVSSIRRLVVGRRPSWGTVLTVVQLLVSVIALIVGLLALPNTAPDKEGSQSTSPAGIERPRQ